MIISTKLLAPICTENAVVIVQAFQEAKLLVVMISMVVLLVQVETNWHVLKKNDITIDTLNSPFLLPPADALVIARHRWHADDAVSRSNTATDSLFAVKILGQILHGFWKIGGPKVTLNVLHRLRPLRVQLTNSS